MADMRKATLSVNVAIDTAMKNLQSIKTQFQSLDKLGTKNLTSSLNSSTKSMKELSGQMKNSGAREFSGDVAEAQEQVKDMGFTGIQAGGLITNAFNKAKDGIGGLIGSMGSIKGALAGLGISAAIGGAVYSAANAQIDKQGALTLAKQRGWHESELNELESFMNERNAYVSKSDVYLLAQRGAAYAQDTEEIKDNLDAETKLFANYMGPLRDKGINSIVELDEAIKKGDESVLTGILNIKPGALTGEVMNKALLAARRETGGEGAAGFDESFSKWQTYYKYQDALRAQTKDLTIDETSAAAHMLTFNKTLSDLQTTLGEQLLPTVSAWLDALNKLINFLGPTATGIVAVSAAGLGFVAILGMILPLIKGVFVAMRANPFGILITALAIILPMLYDYANKMGYIKKATEWLSSLDIGSKLNKLGDVALKVIFPAATFMSPVLIILKFLWDNLGNIGAILQKTYDLISRFVSWVLAGVSNIVKWLTEIKTTITSVFTDLKTALEALPSKIKEAIGMGEEKKLNSEQIQMARDQAAVLLSQADMGLDRNQIHKLLDPLDKYLTRTLPSGETQYKWAGGQAEKAWMSEGWKDVTDTLEIPIEKYDEAMSMIAAGRASGDISYSVPPRAPESARENLAQWVVNPRQDAVGQALARGDYTEAVHEANPMANLWEYGTSMGGAAWDSFKGLITGQSHATGGMVPRDGLAMLHTGERVLTAGQAAGYSNANGGVTVNMTINNPMFTDSASMRKFDQYVRDLINRENLIHMTNKRGRGTVL